MKQPTIKQLDNLWAECVKAKAGYKSEISGKQGRQIGGEYILNAHHLYGKPNSRLRYELDNGICLTAGEHHFDAHGTRVRMYAFEKKVEVFRPKIFDRMLRLKRINEKPDKWAIKIYLETELKKYGK